MLLRLADNLMAYDRRNELLNIPENEIHVITDAIDNYKPQLRVQFINFQNVKRRNTLSIRVKLSTMDGPSENVRYPSGERVPAARPRCPLRFGGGSKAHFPYNRVVDWQKRDEVDSESSEQETTTLPPTAPSTTPKQWAKTTTTTLTPYSAEPALILPSRFHRKKEDVVIVFKKKQRSSS
uniref:Uncharacterized protein n=1 Tax=Caenorhabditis japonica TaxID=281687 RepID=A0A8R1HTF3_CAEJA